MTRKLVLTAEWEKMMWFMEEKAMASKMIDGKQYRYFTTYPTKRQATTFAKANRAGGFFARVEKAKDGYAVWLRGK